MYGIIYKATNNINKKTYIGKTVNSLESRKYGHIRDAKRGVTLLFHRALRKYNFNFSWEIIHIAQSKEELKEGRKDQEFWNIIKYKTKNFWLDLDWMPDGKELWNFIKMYNPTLLSTPAPAWADPDCSEDKKKWVRRELGDIPLILSRNKYEYAEENTILIDDMDKNIIPWKENGGIAIKHTSTADTIRQLKKIIM